MVKVQINFTVQVQQNFSIFYLTLLFGRFHLKKILKIFFENQIATQIRTTISKLPCNKTNILEVFLEILFTIISLFCNNNFIATNIMLMAIKDYTFFTNPKVITQDRLLYTLCLGTLHRLHLKIFFKSQRTQELIYMPLHTFLYSFFL